MTFITFYTPTYKRPTFLAACKRSVKYQTEPDYQHMVIVDDTGIGIDGMFRDIRRHVDQIRGEYVFILADDDRLYDKDGVKTLKAWAHSHQNPPVIIVRNHKWGQVFPTVCWGSEPLLGAIDTGNFVIRADVFRENADQFGLRYEGDYDFIHNLWEKEIPFEWFDYVFSEMQIGGKGMTEDEILAAGAVLRVKAIRSFVSRVGNKTWRISAGQEFDLPLGTDWIRAGLVEPCVSAETATIKAPERAVLPMTKEAVQKPEPLDMEADKEAVQNLELLTKPKKDKASGNRKQK